MIKDKSSKEITVHDNRKVCSDAEEFVNSLSSLFIFRYNSKPIEHDITRVIEGRSGTYAEILEGLRFGDLDNVCYDFDLYAIR
ncbi:MAG: hypothetical protein GEU26_14675 [Nitrososphaeraceae archaeon]|nr:hypothetical protein [Nitrososphaeraceae archaeon]